MAYRLLRPCNTLQLLHRQPHLATWFTGSLRDLASAVRRAAGPTQPRSRAFMARAGLDTDVSAASISTAFDSHVVAPPPKQQINFCRLCGSKMRLVIPNGESQWRHVCSSCGYIDYLNPKMVVGCIVEHQGKILLCRRAIEPCKGLWTLPAGFMELNESTAAVHILGPYTHLDIPAIGQAYILFRAQLAEPYTFSPGPETLEAQMFAPEDIPYGEIAFSSVSITLRQYLNDVKQGQFRVHHGVIDKLPGSSPNDVNSFVLKDHYCINTTGPGDGRC